MAVEMRVSPTNRPVQPVVIPPYGFHPRDMLPVDIPFHGRNDSAVDNTMVAAKLDKGKGRADDVEETGAVDDADEDNEDTDEEEDKQAGVPRILLVGVDGQAADGEEDLSWASVAPPAALTEILIDGLSPVLLEIVQESVASVQSQADKALADRAARAEREVVAGTDATATPTEKEEATAVAAATDRPGPVGGKGKEVERQPPLQLRASTATVERQSRRRLFAARIFRHMHADSSRSQDESAGKSSTAERERATAATSTPQLKAVEAATMTNKIECVSCFDEVPAQEAVQMVCHSYCMDCFHRLVATALDNEAQFPPKCCLNEIPSRTIQRYASRQLRLRYAAKAEEYGVPVAERLYCAHVDCGLYIPPKHTSRAARIARCRRGHETCTLCRQPAHGTDRQRRPCPEDRDQQLADALAADAGWQRCIRCAVLIEHRDACQHMTCRCGAEFCYVCGAVWRTCACSMDDLMARKAQAAQRNAAREARDRANAAAAAAAAAQADREMAELREALRQVEAFEHAAAQQQAAQRTAQRQRLAILRAERETVLQKEAATLGVRLRQQLTALTAAQTEAARQQRVAERVARRQAATAARRALAADDQRKAAAVTEAAERGVAAVVAAWAEDYQARVRLEQRAEAAYAADLQAQTDNKSLWAGRADRAQRVAAAVRAYQRRNDERLDAYLAWRDQTLAAARARAAEACAVQGALRARAAVLAGEARQAAAQQQARQQAAERRWMRAVEAERERRLEAAVAAAEASGLAGAEAAEDVQLRLLLEILAVEGGDGVDGLDTADLEEALRRQAVAGRRRRGAAEAAAAAAAGRTGDGGDSDGDADSFHTT